jgi:hypothetical protein
MAFDNASLFIDKDGAGNYVVAPTIVRWRGQQSFRIDSSPPTSSDPNQPAGQPFAIANVRKDTNPTFRIADLTFVGVIGDWHSCFDSCDSFSQAMVVDGNGQLQTLRIDVSCHVHQKQFLAQVLGAIHAAVAAVVTGIATVFLLITRRIFTRTST